MDLDWTHAGPAVLAAFLASLGVVSNQLIDRSSITR